MYGMGNATMEVSPDAKHVRFSKKCAITGNLYEVTVTMEQFRAWREGGLIQDVMPELNADQREFLITRMTPEEWEVAMGPEV